LRDGQASAPVRETLTTPTPPPVKRRRALWVIAAMLLALGVIAGVGYWRIRGGIESNEAERFAKAETLYKDVQYADAAAAFEKLHRDFPDSPNAAKYAFLAELSDVRQAVHRRESTEETVKALERVRQLAWTYREDALLKEYESDVWDSLDHLAGELTRLAQEEKSPQLLAWARQALKDAKTLQAPPGKNLSERERALAEEWTKVERVIADHVEREQVIAALKRHLERANAAAIQSAFALVEKTKRQDDPGVRALLDELVKAHREQVKFVPANPDAKPTSFSEDVLPSLSVTPSVKAERAVAGNHPLVLSLARGVLYALDPARGEVRWVRRVGIDTNVLPVRVPADAITPELLLTLSSDQRSLSALVAATGETLWQAPLSDACLGQPVLVDGHVLAATLAGRIDEIEIAEGRLRGSYQIGQPLTLGGVRQPDTALAYFPADEFCMYAIDMKARSCANILYTRHPAGSLRGLPAIVPGEQGPLLLWTELKGSGHVEIKPYELPLKQHDQKPVDPVVSMSALSAPPWPQADRLAVVTQTGMLSLWGLKQKGTRDAELFPLLKHGFPIEASKQPGRCQVVYADAENYWTLTRGRLQRVQTTFDAKDGPGLLARWPHAIVLGNLLHPAQARHEPDGRTILYLTTQAEEHPTCLCSAIDADDGKILWQRQLGVLPRQAPLLVAGQILVRDAQGLMRFDPTKADKPWQPAGEWLAQEPWSDAVRMVLARQTSYVQLTLPRGSAKLRVQVGAIGGDAKPRAFDVALPARLQGTPALGDKFLLAPLADGILAHINLEDGSLTKDLDWRAAGAEELARGHLLLLSSTECILTDASRGVVRIVSSDSKSWTRRASRELPYRVSAAPVLVPGKGTARICVADASGTLTLLDADQLTVLRTWSMPGKITAGPFVRDGKIGCVVGRTQLVWLDPEQKEPAWQYTFADIAGEPNLIEGVLVVADVAGRFVALDPASGRPVGAVLTLHANVAATAAPLPFGPGQAFVPLTDGTVIVLPMEKLRKGEPGA
jgi:outer membrane protein assembly factor BamB